MTSTNRQIQEQKLQQKLAPMQVQYVRMLEMTTPEIEDAVRQAVEDNPALETIDSPALPDEPIHSGNDDALDDQYHNPEKKSAHDWIAAVSTDSNDETLAAHLEKQLAETDTDETTLHIARYLLGEIDNNGRISRTPAQIADDLAFGTGLIVSADNVRKALDIIKTLDPIGVGAYDLQECLLLQLKNIGHRDQATQDAVNLLENHYDLYARRRIDMLQSASGLSIGRLRDADDVIRSLNPKPGAQFAGGDRMERASGVVVPDFNIEVDDNGIITVSLTSNLPELAIAESFGVNTKADEFIRHHREEALGTIKLLQMRSRTLMRTMKAIAFLQREFFLTEDKERIKPMVLRDVAAITGDDLSVISRATAGKYVNTPGGVYPLKMFFSERSQADSSGSGSVHKVLSALKNIIDGENPHHPYSDEALKEKMEAIGYNIARRTIAKYREEKLGIPVARLRRKV